MRRTYKQWNLSIVDIIQTYIKVMSRLWRCPYFRGAFVHTKATLGLQEKFSLFTEVSFFQSVLIREVPLYTGTNNSNNQAL